MNNRKKEFEAHVKGQLQYNDIIIKDLKEYLDELDVQYKKSDSKKALLEKILKATTVNKLYKRFRLQACGVPIYKLRQRYNLSKYQINKMIETGFIDVLYEKKIDADLFKGMVKYMDAHKFYFLTQEKIDKWLNDNIKRKKSLEDRLIELKSNYEDELELVADCLYRINKLAKTYRDLKFTSYDDNNHKVCKSAKTREINIYDLKDNVLEKLLKNHKEHITIEGYHTFGEDAMKLAYINLKGRGFHTSIINTHMKAEDLSDLGAICDLISKENKSNIPADIAIEYLKEWAN